VSQMPRPTHATTTPIHLDLRDPDVRANIYETYSALRGEKPVAPGILTVSDQDDTDFSGTLGRELSFATGYDEALAVLTDDRFAIDGRAVMTPEQLATLPPVPDEFRPLLSNLLSLDPPDHTRLRRLVQPSFTPRTMEAMRPRIQAIAEELLDAAERAAAARMETAPNRMIELIDAFAYPLPMTVISELLGVPMEDRAQVRAWSEALIESQAPTEEMRSVLVDFTAYLRQLFEQKRRQPADDLTSQLVHAEEEGDKLDDEELLSMVFILIVAGHVTTVNLIGNAVLALLTHPDQLARLHANPELVKGAVEETLRFWGPVEMAAPRFARDDLEFAGTTIRRGRAVLPVLAAADRDPERFPSPDRFDIERPDASRHVAFGKGVHLCLGAPLARVEGQIAVETVFRRLPELRLAEPLDAPPIHPSLFRGPERLSLLF
jgi:cytochrome P450 family 107 subfamily K polypeptide 1